MDPFTQKVVFGMLIIFLVCLVIGGYACIVIADRFDDYFEAEADDGANLPVRDICEREGIEYCPHHDVPLFVVKETCEPCKRLREQPPTHPSVTRYMGRTRNVG